MFKKLPFFLLLPIFCFAQPINDNCISAIALSVGNSPAYQTYTNVAATNSTITSLPTCGNYNSGIDVWFTATVPASGRLIVQMDRTGSGSAQNKALAAYSGSCAALTQLACSTNGSPDDGVYSPYMYLSGQTPGATIYLRVFTENNAGGSTFQITAFDPIVPSNETCATATALTVGSSCSYATYSNQYSLGDPGQTAPGCGPYQGVNDVWFSATVPASGRLIVQLKGGAGGSKNKAMAVYSGSCGSLSLIDCSTNGSPDNSIYSPYAYLSGLTPTSVVYIRVFTEGNIHGNDFDICVFEPLAPSNETCANATALTVGSSCSYATYSNQYSLGDAGQTAPGCGSYEGVNDVWFSVVVPSSGRLIVQLTGGAGGSKNKAMAIYTGSCGSLSLLDCSTDGSPDNGIYSPYAYLNGLTPTSVVYIRVFTEGNIHGNDFDICAFEPSPIPSNETCATATTLTVGSTCSYATYSNKYSIGDPSQVAPGCGSYQGANDVWFSVVVPPSGRLIVQLTGGAGGSKNKAMAIYSGSCGSLSLLDCSTNGSPDNGIYSPYFYLVGLTPSSTVFIRVYSESTLHGNDFDICAFEPSPIPSNETCATATALTIGSSCSYASYSNKYSIGDPSQTAPGCGNYEGVNDVWFSATVPASGRLIVQITGGAGGSKNKAMAIYTGSCGSLSLLDCSTNGSLDDGVYSPYVYLAGLTPSTTVFIRVYSENTLHGNDFDICAFEPTPIPNNETCATATALTVSSSCAYATYSNKYSIGDPSQTAPGCGSYKDVNDVWFSAIVPPSGRLIVQITGGAGGSKNKAMAIYTGSCGSLSLLECRTNGSPDDGVYSPYSYIVGLTPATVVYVRVFSENGLHGEEFGICAFEPSPIPSNESCINAISLPVSTGTCNLQQYTSAYSLGDPGQTAPSCGAYQGVSDVWFSVVVPPSGNLQLSIDRVSGMSLNTAMAVYSGSCGTLNQVSCAISGSPIDGAFSPGITITNSMGFANQTLYVRVWSESSLHGGPFLLCAFDPPTYHVWTGASNSDWFDVGNWDLEGVPNSNGHAIIPPGVPNFPVLQPGPTVEVLSLEVQENADFTGASVGSSHSEISIYGNLIANGDINIPEGTVAFVGAGNHSILGDVLIVPDIGVLAFNTDVFVKLNLKVNTLVNPLGGILSLNGRELLLSSSAVNSYAQIAKGLGTISGNTIKVERHFSTADGWRQIGLPVGTSLSSLQNWSVAFAGAAFPSIYWWDATDAGSGIANGWQAAISSNGNSKAYTSLVDGVDNPIANPVYITGSYVNGDQSFTLHNTTDPNDAGNEGWNFLPNPFATNLNILSLVDDYNATGSSSPTDYPLGYKGVHVWNGGDNSTGQYVTWINGVVTGATHFDGISPFTGFWIKMENTDDPTENFVIRDAHRDTSVSSYSSLKSTKPIIRLEYRNGAGRLDDAALYIQTQSEMTFNPRFDAYKLLNSSSGQGELYFVFERDDQTENVAIKSIPNTLKVDTIPLGIIHNHSHLLGEFTLNLEDYEGEYNFKIWDSHLDILHDIKAKSYRFVQTGADENRFELIIVHKTEDRFVEAVAPLQLFSHEDIIKVLSDKSINGNLVITDVLGRMVWSKNNVEFPANQLLEFRTGLSGLYIVTLHQHSGQVDSQKVYLK